MRLAVDLPGVTEGSRHHCHGVLTIEGFRRTMSVDGSSLRQEAKISRRYAIDGCCRLNNPRQISNSACSLSKLLKNPSPVVRVNVTKMKEILGSRDVVDSMQLK
jgi:hypothetical protein